ncbi:hypothetical protein HK096_008047, partial [Nowakowskiella sp. JEL0078]
MQVTLQLNTLEFAILQIRHLFKDAKYKHTLLFLKGQKEYDTYFKSLDSPPKKDPSDIDTYQCFKDAWYLVNRIISDELGNYRSLVDKKFDEIEANPSQGPFPTSLEENRDFDKISKSKLKDFENITSGNSSEKESFSLKIVDATDLGNARVIYDSEHLSKVIVPSTKEIDVIQSEIKDLVNTSDLVVSPSVTITKNSMKIESEIPSKVRPDGTSSKTLGQILTDIVRNIPLKSRTDELQKSEEFVKTKLDLKTKQNKRNPTASVLSALSKPPPISNSKDSISKYFINADIEYETVKGDSTLATHKLQAQLLFRTNDYDGAVISYRRALLTLNSDQDNFISTVLQNLSATYFHLDEPLKALRCASASLCVLPSAKAYYRAAKSLKNVEALDIALWCAIQALKFDTASDIVEFAQTLETDMTVSDDGEGSGWEDEDNSERTEAEVKYLYVTIVAKSPGPDAEEIARLVRKALPETKDHLALKERGNDAFRKGNFEVAAGYYFASLKIFVKSLASLMGNIAACEVNKGGRMCFEEAILFTAAALVLDPSHEKSRDRLTAVLWQMNAQEAAKHQNCGCGHHNSNELTTKNMTEFESKLKNKFMQMVEEESALKLENGSEKKNLLKSGSKLTTKGKDPKSKLMATSSKHPTLKANGSQKPQLTAKKSVSKFVKELDNTSIDFHNLALEDILDNATSEHAKNIWHAIDFDPESDENLKKWEYKPPVPDFYSEYINECLIPADCNRRDCFERLKMFHEYSTKMGWVKDALISNNVNIKDLFILHAADVTRRLNADINASEWLTEPKEELVRLQKRNPYSENVCFSFSTYAHEQVSHYTGNCHISVGFLDFGELSSIKLVPGTKEPFRYIGYESSAYSIAKSLVILEMITQKSEVDNILEVWYSSAWTESTLTEFKNAVLSALARGQTEKQNAAINDSRVIKFLFFWSHAMITKAEARKKWLDTFSMRWWPIPLLNHKEDRLALISYFFSGEIPLSGSPTVHGSLCMFGIPPNEGVPSMNNVFLQTILLTELYKARYSPENKNIIQAGISILRKRITSLVTHISVGIATVDLRLAKVSPTNTKVTDEIRMLNPSSINWGDLPDFINPVDFHTLAKKCGGKRKAVTNHGSGPKQRGYTTHYFISTLWPADVRGAWMVDYLFRDLEERKQVVTLATSDMAPSFLKIKDNGTELDLSSMIRSTPLDTVAIVDYALRSTLFGTWAQKWLSVGGIEKERLEKQCVLEFTPYNLFSIKNCE